MTIAAKIKGPTPDANGALPVTSIIVLNDTAANLASVVPLVGQYALATDTRKIVMGDGVTTFSALNDSRAPEVFHEVTGTQAISLDDGNNHNLHIAFTSGDITVTFGDPVAAGQIIRTVVATALFQTVSLVFGTVDMLLQDSLYNSNAPGLYDIPQTKQSYLHLEAVPVSSSVLAWMPVFNNGIGAWI